MWELVVDIKERRIIYTYIYMAQYTNLSRLQSRLNVVFLGEARRGLSVHVYPTVFDCTNVVASAIERLVIMIDFLLLKSIIVLFGYCSIF